MADVAARLDGADDQSDVLEGWQRLRDVLGEDPFSSSSCVLDHFLGNLIPTALRRHALLGDLLAFLPEPGAIGRLRDRLVSPHENTVRGVLAELSVLHGLCERGARARLIRASGKGVAADIKVEGETSFEIEVSYLGHARHWQEKDDLHAVLEPELYRLFSEHPAFIEVECSGYPGPLLRQSRTAIERITDRVADQRPWTADLTDGLRFTVRDGGPATFVYMHGATIYAGDLGASESPLKRIPAKVEEEARQVADGGVVFIYTSQLSLLLLQGPDSHRREVEEAIYAMLIELLVNVGERQTNVGAFAILDVIGTEPRPLPTVPKPNTLWEATTQPRGLQRLLWVPNPHAEQPAPDGAHRLLTPPLL